jgi:RNA polymerase sigma-70 factor (ECF subfamily)
MARRRTRSRPMYAPEDAGRHQPDEGLAPDQDLARQRRVSAFVRLLDRLSDKKRTVFVLHELEGMPPAEIAELVNCPVLTVRTRLHYARRELAQMMRNEPSLSTLADLAEREASAKGTLKTSDESDKSEQQDPVNRATSRRTSKRGGGR